jgi:hypothetical protein
MTALLLLLSNIQSLYYHLDQIVMSSRGFSRVSIIMQKGKRYRGYFGETTPFNSLFHSFIQKKLSNSDISKIFIDHYKREIGGRQAAYQIDSFSFLLFIFNIT